MAQRALPQLMSAMKEFEDFEAAVDSTGKKRYIRMLQERGPTVEHARAWRHMPGARAGRPRSDVAWRSISSLHVSGQPPQYATFAISDMDSRATQNTGKLNDCSARQYLPHKFHRSASQDMPMMLTRCGSTCSSLSHCIKPRLLYRK